MPSSQIDVNSTDIGGNTPLHYAATEGHADVIDVLLKHGTLIDPLSRERYTPLHDAAKHANESAIRKLVEKGANINLKKGIDIGYSAVGAASQVGANSIVKILLDHGAKLDEALQAAALEDQAEVLSRIPMCKFLNPLWYWKKELVCRNKNNLKSEIGNCNYL